MTASSPMKVFGGTWRSAGALAAFLTLSVGIASADSIAYVTTNTTAGKNITAWDITTNTIAVLTNSADGAPIDSVMFINPTTILYSTEPGLGPGGSIDKFTCSMFAANGTCGGVSTNTVLSTGSGLFNEPADMVLDPSMTTFLVANDMNNQIDRVNVATGVATLVRDFGMRTDGLAYDNAGNLFVVLNQNTVAQINPTTGATIKTIGGLNMADGLSYNTTNNTLYVGSDGGGFYTINDALTTSTFTNVNNFVIDGLASVVAPNGHVLVYLIQRGVNALQYDATTGAITQTSPGIAGADDIAPPTFGSITPTTPEPSTSLLIGAGLLLVGFGTRRLKFSGQ